MLNHVAIVALLLFSVLGLLSSDCRSPEHLVSMATTVESPAPLLYRAAKANSPEAIVSLRTWANRSNEPYWLNKLAQLGDAESFYQLAVITPDFTEHRRLLSKAAERNHPAAQHELALVTRSEQVKLHWLNTSASQDYLPAQISLYQWHLLNQDDQNALIWLTRAAATHAESQFVLAKLLWKNQQRQDAIRYFALAKDNGHNQAKRYVAHLKKHAPVSKISPATASLGEAESCNMRIQPLATSLESSVQSQRFMRRYAQDSRLQGLNICINDTVWLEEDLLSCSANWQKQRRLGCDLAPLTDVLYGHDFTHLVIFAAQGKANVNGGVMYLDLADTYSVFVHELAHFAGFVDEYPLSSGLASVHCQSTKAPNVVTAVKGAPYDLNLIDKWLGKGYPLAISRTRTCNNHDKQAYKPVAEMTFMEFHDEGQIPPLYIRLWEQQLANVAALTPAYRDLAVAAFERNNGGAGEYWQQRMRGFYQADVFSPQADGADRLPTLLSPRKSPQASPGNSPQEPAKTR